ncbi:cytochrome d ubiquinol oxidase subunit II [Nocardioides aquiterrae]|uniref:Cytochrome d ubiquinol oxidase subunit II n=1 Tax=Nocardioides aquiterrae TaxID=203799 RepID=A0ABN1UHY6_9ACTN
MASVVAAALVLGLLAYAAFGGADFGAGFWDLTAGGPETGAQARARIDASVGPVWEANHTWLIYCLVVMWTAFPEAFAAVMTTLYVPLGIAALGIVLRGSGFAFRKVLWRTPHARLAGLAFSASSVLTPFAFGTVAGAIASGRVPAGGYGPPFSSWLSPSALMSGLLAVAVCAYLAAVFLTADAHAAHEQDLEDWFGRRARAAAVVTGVVSLVGLVVARADAPLLFDNLLTRAWPLALCSVAAGTAALLLLRRASPRLIRAVSWVAVTALVLAWVAAQAPYLLGTHTTIGSAAAPRTSLDALAIVIVVAVAIITPSFALLYVLQQRSRLHGG